jgi:PAS domain S-box-containing protein
VRLRAYLLFLTLATLLPVAVFAGIVGYFLAQEQRETFRRGAEARTLAMSTAVDTELNGSIATLQALATLPALDGGDVATFRDRAERILATQPDWSDINLALPSGQQIMNLQRPAGAPLPDIAKFDPSWKNAVERRAPFVSDLVVGPITGQWDYAVRVPVIRAGSLKYVLSAVVKPESMSRLLKAQDVPADWVAVVLDRSDRIVARTVNPQSVGQLASQNLRDALARAPSGWFRGSTIEGAAVYTPYRRSQTSGWAFAMGIPASAVDAAAWRAAGLLALALLGAVVLAFQLAHIVGRRMSAPIGALASATDAIGRGEQVPVPQSAPITEIGRLARTLHECIEALREREERLQLALDAGRMGNWEWNVQTGKVTWSTELEAIHGLAPGTFPGTFDAYKKDIHPEDLKKVQRAITGSLERGEHHVEYRIVRPDGSTRWVEGRGKVFRDERGAPARVIGVCTDITERKQAELALQEADRAKDEFLAMLSHELRNPLAGLSAAAHVLNIADPASDAAMHARGVVERQTKHMSRLVADLLDMSRVTLGKLTLQRGRIDIADAVSSVVSTWRASGRLESHEVLLTAEPAWVDGDRERIEQIAANLLDNALKFTPAGRTVSITVCREGAGAVLRVADQGVGLAAEDCARVFDLFVQADSSEPAATGLGIGLALVKKLAELHGGSASASSEGRGHGAVFTVRLPAVEPPAAQVASSPAAPVDGARSILVVEDNDDARQMLAAMLALGGHVVRAARDGHTGLALAAAAAPDVALIDVALPDIDGYEVARRLRAAPIARGARRMGLVAVTGFGQEEDQRRAFEAGFDAHLVKPVSAERLEQVIAQLQ